MNVVIIGSEGRLGKTLCGMITRETGWKVVAVTRRSVARDGVLRGFDAGDHREWKSLLGDTSLRPAVVVNAAGLSDLDRCEVDRQEAWESNAALVQRVVDQCRRYDHHFVQISTGYVFDGRSGPYDESARPNPINFYGRTKLAAENVCIRSGISSTIIRTMWLYGEQSSGRRSFPRWVVEQLRKGKLIRISGDELGSPTLVDDLAYGIIKAIERRYRGTINIAGPAIISRFEFAREIARIHGLSAAPLQMVDSHDLHREARRPLNAGLISLMAQGLLGLRFTPMADGIGLVRRRN